MKNFKLVSMLSLSVVMLSGCGGNKTVKEPEPQKNTKDETLIKDVSKSELPTLKVGVVPNLEPYAFRDENREFHGFNIDLVNEIAIHEGFNVQYMETPWDAHFNFLKSGKVDFIGSVVSINSERDKIIDFSDTYIQSSVNIASSDALKNSTFNTVVDDKSLKFSVMSNTVFHEYPLSLGISEKQIFESKSQYTSISDIFSDNADAAFLDSNTLKYYKREFPTLNVINNPDDIIDFAFAIQEGDTELQNKLNTGLTKVKADGTYDKIYAKWFTNK